MFQSRNNKMEYQRFLKSVDNDKSENLKRLNYSTENYLKNLRITMANTHITIDSVKERFKLVSERIMKPCFLKLAKFTILSQSAYATANLSRTVTSVET